MPTTHVIVSTHTTRHLRRTLMGIAAQRARPETVVVSIDNTSVEVRDLCRACSKEFDLEIRLAWREWPREVRVGQVRNNGVRALLATRKDRARTIARDDWLHFLDGDSAAPADMLETAAALRQGSELLVGGRILLSEEQTETFDEEALIRGKAPVDLEPAQLAEAAARHARYVRQLRLKPLRLVKMHKPKVLGANHACTADIYRRVDGYDETFLGAWREDDDFGRRVYLAGARACVAVKTVCVLHLWHPLNPQKRENWSELPDRAKGRSPWLPRAGMSTPRPQDTLHWESVVRGKTVDAGTLEFSDSALKPVR
jgi:hypothetical protein